MKKLILFIILVLSVNTFADLDNLHKKALNSYKSKNLREAINIYEDKGLENILKEAAKEYISDKKLAGILNDYAFFLIKDGQIHKAKYILNKVVELDNKRATAYYNLAEIYDKEGMEHQAREVLLIYSYLSGADKFLKESKLKYNSKMKVKVPKLIKKYLRTKDLLSIKTKSLIVSDLKKDNDIDYIIYILTKTKEKFSIYQNDSIKSQKNLWSFLISMDNAELIKELYREGFDFAQEIDGKLFINYLEDTYSKEDLRDIYPLDHTRVYDTADELYFDHGNMYGTRTRNMKINNYEIPKFEDIKSKLVDLYKKTGKEEKLNVIDQKNIERKTDQIYEYHNSDLAEIYYDYALYLMKDNNTTEAIRVLEKGEKLNIKYRNYYLKVAELYEILGAKKKIRRALKKYLILNYAEGNPDSYGLGESFISYPNIFYRNLSKRELLTYESGISIGYGYIFTDDDFEAIKLMTDYKPNNNNLEVWYGESAYSLYDGIKIFSNQELMKHYKKYRKDEFDKINKTKKDQIYSENNSSTSKVQILKNAEKLSNLINFDEVKKYLEQNEIYDIDEFLSKNIALCDLDDYYFIGNFCLAYINYYLNKGEVEIGLEKLSKIAIAFGNSEKNVLWGNYFYLRVAKLFEKYAYSKGIKIVLKRYLIQSYAKYNTFSLGNYPLFVQRNLSIQEIKAFGTKNINLYSRKLPNRYKYKKSDKSFIKYLIRYKLENVVYGEFNFFVDGVNVNIAKFLREYEDQELIDYYKKTVSKDYDKDSLYTVDEILKRLENEYLEAKSEEIFKFLDKLKSEELIKTYDESGIKYSADCIYERLEKIYKNLNSKEKVKFLNKINIDYLLDREIKNHETPYCYNEKLGEFALKYATYLIESDDGKKAVDILNKTTTIYNSEKQDYYLKAAKIYQKEEQTAEMKKMLKKYLLLNNKENTKFPEIITKNLSKEDIEIFGKKIISLSTNQTFRKDYIGKEDNDLLTLVIDYENIFSDYTFLINGKKVTIDEVVKIIKQNKGLKNYY